MLDLISTHPRLLAHHIFVCTTHDHLVHRWFAQQAALDVAQRAVPPSIAQLRTTFLQLQHEAEVPIDDLGVACEASGGAACKQLQQEIPWWLVACACGAAATPACVDLEMLQHTTCRGNRVSAIAAHTTLNSTLYLTNPPHQQQHHAGISRATLNSIIAVGRIDTAVPVRVRAALLLLLTMACTGLRKTLEVAFKVFAPRSEHDGSGSASAEGAGRQLAVADALELLDLLATHDPMLPPKLAQDAKIVFCSREYVTVADLTALPALAGALARDACGA